MGYSFFGVFDSEGLSYNHFKTLDKAIKPTKCRIKLKNKNTMSDMGQMYGYQSIIWIKR